MNSAVPSAPTFAPAAGWKQAGVALVVIELVLLALYFDTARAMVEIWWRSGTFNHAFLVPPISLWLIWEKRHLLAQESPRPTPWLLLPLALIAFGWLLGELVAVNVLTQFALVAMLVLAVPLVIGLPAAKRILFPLAFLFFAVPFGEFVMPAMMDWTAKFTVMGLRASGIPVYQEGLHFVIPSGKWSVVEACSGIRYLIASIVVGTLYAYLNYRSLKRRLIFVGVAIAVPVVANWLRAYMIVMLGHLSGNTLAVGVDHLIYGWVFFGAVMLIMFAIGLRWRESETTAPAEAERVERQSRAAPQPRNVWVAMVLASSIALAPHGVLALLDSGPVLPALQLSPEALATGGWQRLEAPLTDWQPAYANPTTTLNATFARGEQRIGVFIAWYQHQNYQRKLISSSNGLVTSANKAWAQVGRAQREAPLGAKRVSVHSSTLRSLDALLAADPPRLTVWHWYWIDGHVVINDMLGKLRLAWEKLSGRGDASAAVFVYAFEPGSEAALSDFLAAAGDKLDALLEDAARRR
ncbi:exosortase A [Sulfuricystis thermophila]|uniref:exosortase A n=1 Tax=Sulfuricystis thermophila TaxID=2496847 RepID=UPI0010358FBE|nr:exosortase A [Sulfuricystis thermophila]